MPCIVCGAAGFSFFCSEECQDDHAAEQRNESSGLTDDEAKGIDDDFWACTDCGDSGNGSHACQINLEFPEEDE